MFQQFFNVLKNLVKIVLQQTALHWSAYYNNPEHVKLLIKHDSNIGIPDIEGKIPLHWAANNKDPSAIHTVKCILVRKSAIYVYNTLFPYCFPQIEIFFYSHKISHFGPLTL